MAATLGSVRVARFGPFRVDFRAGELHKHGVRIRLQDQPLQILALLLDRPGEVVTREELQQKLWPSDTFVDFDHGLNNAINRLREALADSAESPRYIETIPRRGYRFIAEVERDPSPSQAPAATVPLPGSQRKLTLALGLTLAGVVAAVWVLNAWTGRFAGGAAADPARSTAVLGLNEGEKARLARVRSVNSESFEFYSKGRLRYLRENPEDNRIAIEMLERAVAAEPNFAEAYAALATAYRVRAFTLERKGEQRAWEEKAFVALEKAKAMDPELPDIYLAEGYFLWSLASGYAHERAIQVYRHALALNPNLAEAHHQMANIYNHVGLFDKASEQAQRAMELEPLNVGARFRPGVNLLYRGKYEEALLRFETTGSQGFFPLLWGFQTSFTLFQLGRKDEAAKRVNEFLQREPGDPGGMLTSMQALLAAEAGDARRAEQKIQEAIRIGDGYQHYHHTAYIIACAYARMNKPESALKFLRRAAEDGFPCYPLFEHDANLNNIRKDSGFVSFMNGEKKRWEHFKAVL